MQSAVKMPRCGPRSQPRGGSRKGRPNKISKVIKDEVLESLKMVGGRDYLARQAEANPAAYLNLLAKIIPHQMKNEAPTVKFVVQTITGPFTPVRGVINSPIKEHIWREPEVVEPAALPYEAATDTR
jgi:hypothetical protein